jgi:hypothetical protein
MVDHLSFTNWQDILKKVLKETTEGQYSYYRRNGTCYELLALVALDPKRFGTAAEKIIRDLFQLEPTTSSQNDGTRLGKKLEIKCARYWMCKDNCRWEHLEPEHDYDYVLFVLLDFNGWKTWCIKKTVLMGEYREKKIVTYQGKQGWWVQKSAILSYLTEINNIQELDAFLNRS